MRGRSRKQLIGFVASLRGVSGTPGFKCTTAASGSKSIPPRALWRHCPKCRYSRTSAPNVTESPVDIMTLCVIELSLFAGHVDDKAVSDVTADEPL